MGVAGSTLRRKLALNRKAQAYWRKYYRRADQSDVHVMDVRRTLTDLAKFAGMDRPLDATASSIVSDREGKGQTNIYRVRGRAGRREQ